MLILFILNLQQRIGVSDSNNNFSGWILNVSNQNLYYRVDYQLEKVALHKQQLVMNPNVKVGSEGVTAQGYKFAKINQFVNGDQTSFVNLPNYSFSTVGLSKLPEGRSRLTIKNYYGDYICRNLLISCASDIQLKILPHMGPSPCLLTELNAFKKRQEQQINSILYRKVQGTYQRSQSFKSAISLSDQNYNLKKKILELQNLLKKTFTKALHDNNQINLAENPQNITIAVRGTHARTKPLYKQLENSDVIPGIHVSQRFSKKPVQNKKSGPMCNCENVDAQQIIIDLTKLEK